MKNKKGWIPLQYAYRWFKSFEKMDLLLENVHMVPAIDDSSSNDGDNNHNNINHAISPDTA